jgi:enamine deaminase RidA (YjgF/YER057c/UK114 family)
MFGLFLSKSGSKAMSIMWSSRQISSIKRIGVADPRMSRIVVNNGVVYISGQTDATGKTIEGQTKNVLAKVDALLEEAGTDKSKLLTSSIWLKDRETDYDGFNDVWNNWIDPDQKPVQKRSE